MSAKVKKAGRIGTKFVAAFLFVFLVMFNVQIGFQDEQSEDISLFGLKLSLFTPSIVASSDPCGCVHTMCHEHMCVTPYGTQRRCDTWAGTGIACCDDAGCF